MRCDVRVIHTGERHYSHRPYRALREAQLRNSPLCIRCGQVGQEVDHIIPRRMGGTDDPYNLQTLCSLCHKLKTMADSQFGGMQWLTIT